MYKGELFEVLSESICSECLAGTEDCLPGSKECRFWGDMEELATECERLEEFARKVVKSASNYAVHWDEVAASGY